MTKSCPSTSSAASAGLGASENDSRGCHHDFHAKKYGTAMIAVSAEGPEERPPAPRASAPARRAAPGSRARRARGRTRRTRSSSLRQTSAQTAARNTKPTSVVCTLGGRTTAIAATASVTSDDTQSASERMTPGSELQFRHCRRATNASVCPASMSSHDDEPLAARAARGDPGPRLVAGDLREGARRPHAVARDGRDADPTRLVERDLGRAVGGEGDGGVAAARARSAFARASCRAADR